MKVELRRCTLQFRFSFFAVLTLMLLLSDETIALLCLLSSLVHESGHFLMLRLFHCTLRSVTFGAGGIVITRETDSHAPAHGECLIALGGIFGNFLLSGTALFFYAVTKRQSALLLFGINLLLPLLNLLPVRSLDAWMALSAVLPCRCDAQTTRRILTRLSDGTTVLFVLFTIAYFYFITPNVSLAAVCVYLVVLNAQRF